MLQKNQAFTLLEMSLVLAVIGLVIGGILVARDMIRNAEVQSVISDEDSIKKAISLFKEKYNYLPGDMPTAASFWGTTANGDGNGRIDTFAESMRAWQQLADAGFIRGQYSGIQGNANPNSLAIGTDVPASKVPDCGWMMGYMPDIAYKDAVSNTTITASHGTYLQLVSGGLDTYYSNCLTPIESYGIDTKIDDGLPASGNALEGGYLLFKALIASPNTVWPSSNTVVAGHSACELSPYTQYNTSSSKISCDPFFNTGL